VKAKAISLYNEIMKAISRQKAESLAKEESRNISK
jgi:hypothetical protein